MSITEYFGIDLDDLAKNRDTAKRGWANSPMETGERWGIDDEPGIANQPSSTATVTPLSCIVRCRISRES
jgi:hypothetical protein